MITARKRTNGNNGHVEKGVQARLSALRGDVEDLQKDMRGLVSDIGDSAQDQVQGAVNEAVNTARDAASRVKTWRNKNLTLVRRSVRSEPLKACMLALGAGAVLGAIFFRR